MTQDYARRKPRKRKKATRKKAGSAIPPWLWLATGLCLGLLISFLFHLSGLPGEKPGSDGGRAADTQTAAEADDVEFNFYTLLPQREVMVSTEQRQASRASKDAPASQDNKAEPGYTYYLQAGSFQRREEAEKRRVQLLLLDMAADIEKVRHQGKSWYRVQAGPYQSTSQLAAARDTLSNESIDTLVTKRKPK